MSIAIDDFGTGYSSLHYLRRLPAEVLKIDRQFLVDVDRPRARKLLAGIVSLAAALGMRTVIEGIETAAQLQLATDLGIVYAQGYLWSPPVPADEVPAVMARLLPAVEPTAALSAGARRQPRAVS